MKKGNCNKHRNSKGKATKNGNLNAMKHGAYSEMTILPHEDPKEFEALLEAVKEDYDPQGPTQEDKVLSIAKILWRKRRIARVQQDEVAKAAKRRRSTEWYNNLQLNRVKRVREDLDSGKTISDQELSERLPKKYAEFYANHCLRKSYDSDKDWAKAVVKYLDEYIEWFELLPGLLPKVKAELCEPSVILAELEVEERLDAKMDKDIMAIGRMKTMQQMGLGRRRDEQKNNEPMKRVDSPPTQAEVLPHKVVEDD